MRIGGHKSYYSFNGSLRGRVPSGSPSYEQDAFLSTGCLRREVLRRGDAGEGRDDRARSRLHLADLVHAGQLAIQDIKTRIGGRRYATGGLFCCAVGTTKVQ